MVRILVIEDEEPIRENIVETLEINNFEVVSAANGSDGLTVAFEHRPDLILCDIMMSGMDGYDVLDNVRRTPEIALTPFIFLTAKSDRASMRYGMDMGADDYVSKPFTTDELLNAIQTRIDRFVNVEEHANDQLLATKQELAHVISHELRTPLTSINMAVQLMSQQLDFLSTSDIHDLIDTLGNGTNRLNRLVEQMSLFVQAKSGMLGAEKIRTASRTEAIWTLILGAMNHAQHFIYREHNVQINFDSSQNDIELSCFRDLIIHALAEVIANSIAHSPKDGQVDVTVERLADGVCISIQDYGKGMTQDQIAMALKDFSQVDRDKYEQQGIGIGLTLTNLIIEAHSGKLEFESESGVGTKVNVYLPY